MYNRCEHITYPVKQFTATGILEKKIFCESTSPVSKELNDGFMTEHAMNTNLLNSTIFLMLQDERWLLTVSP